ncbi:hypothetical protein ALP99_101274 [Pseudomonas syringae pv. tomato]|uniref:Uncharacterized protein n=4 Tax=Pseudomonas syringae group TaxID=136849 RepID=Q887H5_PSESM|nr:hypothetical protein PSPTO_1321 [Pseudomonas syringae pv. tomato str. DC3000]KPB79695.1 Uncharacterized protein AC505_4394 [Pseudomonas syringae pv. maculicola]KPB86786.1 Uncharacterized protein AC506_1249 [Pseudomonas syringae pv. maculicola str. M6]MBW8024299.1 hypothetical protein [Pseudomonas syringae pv. tomato]MCF5222959.1 hypothetical protein [Pseudomonas syringae]RMN49567.1 hypothetical protein ALQ59_101382 [Pseudomonas syringae pv. apii]RMO88623.1 hypothetical protein ALQ32_101124
MSIGSMTRPEVRAERQKLVVYGLMQVRKQVVRQPGPGSRRGQRTGALKRLT